jgi:hypothetical protein
MALRAKPPEAVVKRLKLFMFGVPGVGKTTAATQFPKSYIIDCERGAENYDKLIKASGSVLFQTTDAEEIIVELRSLLSEKHDYRTLVIDPITPVYSDLLEKSEVKVGSEFGRHYGEANKTMKRMMNLIMSLDMNVVVTAHAKTEYGENLVKLGYTFDGWKQLDYWFDLVIFLKKTAKRRIAKVVKTRIESFPDESTFDWSYQAICERYGVDVLEREARVITLASPAQVSELKRLMELVKLPEGTATKWLSKASVEDWADMPGDTISKCIEFINKRLGSEAA